MMNMISTWCTSEGAVPRFCFQGNWTCYSALSWKRSYQDCLICCTQRFVSSLAGPVVALAGNGDNLAVVSHASIPLPSGDQVLEFMLLNVRNQKQLLAGRLPLSPASTLTWLGFTEAGSLSSYDSQVSSHGNSPLLVEDIICLTLSVLKYVGVLFGRSV